MHSPYFISYIYVVTFYPYSVAHMELNDWAMLILYASWHDITKWWLQIKRGPYGSRVQARWLSDTRNGQRQNPVQAHKSIGNMKNHETNTTPFSGACNCHSGIYTDFADLFQDKTRWQFATETALFSTILQQEGWQKKKQPCKTQQTACGKHKTRGPFLKTNYRNVTSERSDMALDRKILLPSFRD